MSLVAKTEAATQLPGKNAQDPTGPARMDRRAIYNKPQPEGRKRSACTGGAGPRPNHNLTLPPFLLFKLTIAAIVQNPRFLSMIFRLKTAPMVRGGLASGWLAGELARQTNFPFRPRNGPFSPNASTRRGTNQNPTARKLSFLFVAFPIRSQSSVVRHFLLQRAAGTPNIHRLPSAGVMVTASSSAVCPGSSWNTLCPRRWYLPAQSWAPTYCRWPG